MRTLNQIRAIAANSRHGLLQDAIGAAALMVMLFVGLHLPVIF